MDVKPNVEVVETEDTLRDSPDIVIASNIVETKESYDCNTCSEHFTHPLSLKIHEMLHDENLYCFVCKRKFPAKFFQDHVRKVHMNLVCDLCSKVYVWKKMLRGHMNTHTKQTLYKCDECPKSYLYPGSLKSHKQYIHSILKYVCDKCFRTFTSSATLTRHQKHKHTYKETIYCRICFKEFTDRQLRNLHEHHHLKHKQCQECGETYGNKNLTPHLIKHYGMEKCIHCQKHIHRSLLEYHVEAVHCSYVCSVCEMTFRDNTKYIQHCKSHEEKLVTYRISSLIEQELKMRKKNDEIYTCKICFKTFKKWLSLRRHYINHNGYRPFECEQCMKRFKHSAVLKRHIATIHVDMKFKCEKCFRKFRLEKYLLKHSCNGGKYSCIVCEIKFADRSNLYKHQRTLHSPRTDSCMKQSFNRLSESMEVNSITNVNVMTGNGKRYQCKKCHSTFFLLENFERHFCQALSKTKLDEKESLPMRPKQNSLKKINLECKLCGLVCKTRGGLRMHYIRKHLMTKSEAENKLDDKDLSDPAAKYEEGLLEDDDFEENIFHSEIKCEDPLLDDAACSKIENICNNLVKCEGVLTEDDACSKPEYVCVKTEYEDTILDYGCSNIEDEVTTCKTEEPDIQDIKVEKEDGDHSFFLH